MAVWKKTSVTQQQIKPLCENFNLSELLAAIFVRRGITEGRELLYFLEEDLRFQHQSFSFTVMEDVVERILQAKEEGEKVLIFGDKDVDGITSTAILYSQLKRMGIDVQWRIPLGDDSYGLSIEAIDDFAAQDGTLIITVDCGISNIEEISHANDLGIEVIVTDHHNPRETLPDAIIILDPKLPDSGYPFCDISGAAIAYKISKALRFSQTPFYNAEVCILNLEEDVENKCVWAECIKIKNLVQTKSLREKIVPGVTSIYDLKLLTFLSNQVIYSWNANETKNILKNIFGSGIDFSIMDLSAEISKLVPSVNKKTAIQISKMSTLAKYNEEEKSILKGLSNLYITYCNLFINSKNSDSVKIENEEMQLVALAALADIMPMKNENRIFVKNGISSFKKYGACNGIAELFLKLNLRPDTLTASELSWTVIPSLNAAGRMGQADKALKLLLSESSDEREQLAQQIFDLNEERKSMVALSAKKIQKKVEQSIQEYEEKLCLIVDEEINKGLTGLIAAKIMQDFSVPAIIISKINNTYCGSMRSFGSFNSTLFLESLGDIFINYGGHDFASGFSFTEDKLEAFLNAVKQNIRNFDKQGNIDEQVLDAQIPLNYLNPELFDLIERFSPYGNENKELLFMSQAVTLCDAVVIGKKTPFHLKLSFDTGNFKIPAVYWGEAEKLGKEIFVGKKYDIVYNLDINNFKGNQVKQLIIKDCISSGC
ncbi:MAG: single-stranded-DNA-specific exonuclease RecJ [Treponema sp.]|nr:single-stranded-DNA-specific exonuclease RecJ [Treponema sp.]